MRYAKWPLSKMAARHLIPFIGGNSSKSMARCQLPAPVAQLDRATASGAVGCGFEPRRAHPYQTWFSQANEDLPIPHVRASKRTDYQSICQVLPSGRYHAGNSILDSWEVICFATRISWRLLRILAMALSPCGD